MVSKFVFFKFLFRIFICRPRFPVFLWMALFQNLIFRIFKIFLATALLVFQSLAKLINECFLTFWLLLWQYEDRVWPTWCTDTITTLNFIKIRWFFAIYFFLNSQFWRQAMKCNLMRYWLILPIEFELFFSIVLNYLKQLSGVGAQIRENV